MHTNTNTDAGTKTNREIMIAIGTIIIDTQYTIIKQLSGWLQVT